MDTTQLQTWLFVVIIVLALGFFSIAYVAITNAAQGLPQWAKDMIPSAAKTVTDELTKVAASTPTPVDDIAVSELIKRIEALEATLTPPAAPAAEPTASVG